MYCSLVSSVQCISFQLSAVQISQEHNDERAVIG